MVGAGPGLGRSLARMLASHGHDVVLVARDAGRLERLADELRALGTTVQVLAADAADPVAVASAVRDAGPVHVLAYNASDSPGSLTDVDVQRLRQATDVNVHAAVAAVQAALPSLRASSGAVLLTYGGLALRPRGSYGVLSVGKAALRAAALALAEELQPAGVRVRTVTVKGFIRAGTAFDPDRIAAAFWAALAQEDVETVYTG